MLCFVVQVSEKLEWEENNKESDSVILDDFQTSISASTAGTITWVGQRSASSAGKSGATTISRLVEPNDIRLFRLVKVATNNCQQVNIICRGIFFLNLTVSDFFLTSCIS